MSEEKNEKKRIQEESEKVVKEGMGKVKKEDAKRVLEQEEVVKNKVARLDPERYSGLIGRVKLFFDILKDWWNGKYHLPWFTISGIIFTLLYFINPFDLIPDVIPGIGYLDDANVASIVAALINEDLERYKKWKSKA